MNTRSTLALVALLAIAPAAAAGDTLMVPQQYLTPQLAVDAARAGDNILIERGAFAGPLHIPAGLDGLVITAVEGRLYGEPYLIEYGPCDADAALLVIEANDVRVDGLHLVGAGIAGPRHGVIVSGARVELVDLQVEGFPGDGAVLLGAGPTLQDCTLQALGGSGVVVLGDAGDSPVCTWGGPGSLIDAAIGMLKVAVPAVLPPATGPSLIDISVSSTGSAVRLAGHIDGEVLIDGGRLESEGPVLQVDRAPGSFSVIMRRQAGPVNGPAYLLVDETGAQYAILAREMGFMLRSEDGTAWLYAKGQALPAKRLMKSKPFVKAPTVYVQGTFVGDVQQGDGLDAGATGAMGQGLPGQATP